MVVAAVVVVDAGVVVAAGVVGAGVELEDVWENKTDNKCNNLFPIEWKTSITNLLQSPSDSEAVHNEQQDFIIAFSQANWSLDSIKIP